MEDEPSGSIVPKGTGLFEGLGFRIKLILRLLKDRRVHPLAKLLPIGAVLYLFVPDLAPGPIDDAAVIWLGSYLFVELCPPEVVACAQERGRARDLWATVEELLEELGRAPSG